MCPISFAFKRIHLAALRLYREQIKERVDDSLTPARLDIMRIVYEHEGAGAEGVAQTRIQELLDLHPSVISRMLKRLREIGAIEIWDNPDDVRCNMVSLTQAGKDAMARYLDELGLTMEVEAVMDLGFFGKRDTDCGLREARERNYRMLNQIRIAMRDLAPFLHPWTLKEATHVYNYCDPRHPFQPEHFASLRIDDIDDEIIGVSKAWSAG